MFVISLASEWGLSGQDNKLSVPFDIISFTLLIISLLVLFGLKKGFDQKVIEESEKIAEKDPNVRSIDFEAY